MTSTDIMQAKIKINGGFFFFYPSDKYLIKYKHASFNLESISTGESLLSPRKCIKINIVICFLKDQILSDGGIHGEPS
jgi:hypothetical protein